MLKHDLPYYEKLIAQLKAVSKEIRQNVPHLKMMDDTIAKLESDLAKQEKWFWELPMGLGKTGNQFGGIYPMIIRSRSNLIIVNSRRMHKILTAKHL